MILSWKSSYCRTRCVVCVPTKSSGGHSTRRSYRSAVVSSRPEPSRAEPSRRWWYTLIGFFLCAWVTCSVRVGFYYSLSVACPLALSLSLLSSSFEIFVFSLPCGKSKESQHLFSLVKNTHPTIIMLCLRASSSDLRTLSVCCTRHLILLVFIDCTTRFALFTLLAALHSTSISMMCRSFMVTRAFNLSHPGWSVKYCISTDTTQGVLNVDG